MIFKIFLLKNSAKMAFFTQTKLNCAIVTLVFEKNANFFRRKLSKSQKIVIIISTPDELVEKIAKNVAQPILSKFIHT
jgi:hypothetical protein